MRNILKIKKLYPSSLRFRTIILCLVLTYAMVQSILHSSPPAAVLGAILLSACICIIGMPKKSTNNAVLAVTAAVVDLLALSSWIAYDVGQTAFITLIVLIGWTAFRLPATASAVYAALTISAAASILFFTERHELKSVLTQCIILAGVYILMWGSKVRRSAQAMNELHLIEITAAHEQLEETYEQLRQAHHELEEAAERTLRYAVLEERNRIAADIHDSIGHGLTSVIVQLQALPYVIQSSPENAESTIREVTQVARDCLQDVRTVVHEMGIPHVDAGIIELQRLTEDVHKQSGLAISFNADHCQRHLPSGLSLVLYRALQEGLTNILRHAHASRTEVSLVGNDQELIMSIRDNGQDSGTITPGFGLSTMKARCEKAGGSLSITPLIPHGLELLIQLPASDQDQNKVR